MHHFEDGFTLIELIIVITIMAILAQSIFPAIFWPSKMYSEELRHFDIEMEVQLGFLMLEKIVQSEMWAGAELKNNSNGFLLSQGQKKIICDLSNKNIYFEQNEIINTSILDHIKYCKLEFIHSKQDGKKNYLLTLSQDYNNQNFIFEKVIIL